MLLVAATLLLDPAVFTADNFATPNEAEAMVTKKVLPKSAYCEISGDVVVCAGVYKC